MVGNCHNCEAALALLLSVSTAQPSVTASPALKPAAPSAPAPALSTAGAKFCSGCGTYMSCIIANVGLCPIRRCCAPPGWQVLCDVWRQVLKHGSPFGQHVKRGCCRPWHVDASKIKIIFGKLRDWKFLRYMAVRTFCRIRCRRGRSVPAQYLCKHQPDLLKRSARTAA